MSWVLYTINLVIIYKEIFFLLIFIIDLKFRSFLTKRASNLHLDGGMTVVTATCDSSHVPVFRLKHKSFVYFSE